MGTRNGSITGCSIFMGILDKGRIIKRLLDNVMDTTEWKGFRML